MVRFLWFACCLCLAAYFVVKMTLKYLEFEEVTHFSTASLDIDLLSEATICTVDLTFVHEPQLAQRWAKMAQKINGVNEEERLKQLQLLLTYTYHGTENTFRNDKTAGATTYPNS